jgi:hypothetical protein
MESILPIIGIGLLSLLTFAGIFWVIRSTNQRRAAAYSQLAARHGWSYQRGQGSRAP